MTRLLLKILPDSGRNDLTYLSGKLQVFLTLDQSMTLAKNYSISFHTDTLYTLCRCEGANDRGAYLHPQEYRCTL